MTEDGNDTAGTFEARRTSFGATAAAYDALRPQWPMPTVHWLLGEPTYRLRVLDLGAGTGLGTRTIARLGHEVLAVDPSAGMLAALREAARRLPPEQSGLITATEGPAEALDVPDASMDAVTVFQAWHWFDPGRAEAECARVLRSGGSLGLAWNSWSADPAWLRELAAVAGCPEMLWDPERGADGVAAPAPPGFSAPEFAEFPLEQSLTPEGLVALASTWSPVSVRSDRDAVLDEVRALGEAAADATGRLAFPYVSACFRYRRDS